MMQPILVSLLEDILTHSFSILEDTRETTFEEFVANRQMRQTVERNLIVLGIAAARIREQFPETFQHLPMLQSAISLRTRLAHGYNRDIDNHVIWRTVTVSIPA